ncbi:hypothetical protein C5S31_00435 [ANME-1 cluster archaeon GoMg2]|nr:hypothetical protein [ANME-1 cluster archaeon GoMg2]
MELKSKNALQRIEYLQRELEYLKRDLMLLEMKPEKRQKPSLFGCVRGGDITDEMIEEAKKDLFRRNIDL